MGFAYTYGLTKGTDASSFGGKGLIDVAQYLTFVLRALDYKSETDFRWKTPWELSDRIGLTHGDYREGVSFTRGDVARISLAALGMRLKDSGMTLAEALIAQGVFTREQYASVNGTSGEQADVFDPERVYEKLMAMREVLPDGMIWTGEEHWALEYEDVINGVVTQITFNGYGCAAFALRLTSAAFGKLPLRTLGRGTFRYEDLRVGDTLRIENDTHSAVILELYDDHVVVAEGAYNNSVHWGRSLSREEAVSANYVWTRYPA